MCLQASYAKLAFIPGAFIGCCITFAMAGDVSHIILPLLAGGLLGYAMTQLTAWFISLKAAPQHA
ncbi:Putative uncharacterized protein [Moritella viscosa]|nr:Putative uncharacterized protein [Moritella viscosa]